MVPVWDSLSFVSLVLSEVGDDNRRVRHWVSRIEERSMDFR